MHCGGGGCTRIFAGCGNKEDKMFQFRKYSYVFLWLALLVTVGLVWLFGRETPPVSEEVSASGTAVSSAAPAPPAVQETPVPEPVQEEMVGLWIPYMSLQTTEKTQTAFEENYKKIVAQAKETGVNTLFVHVRPFSDALYPSENFPYSHILTGEQGQDPGYDPLEFMVTYTHQQGLAFHAWINPLRVKTAETPTVLAAENPYSELSADNPFYFMEYEGAVYLNPAYPYIRTLIAEGAAEIVKNYAVDGIHFDDYFYPAQADELDNTAYEGYVNSVDEPVERTEWRTANINAMVAEVYQKVKGEKPEVVFGISPAGNIENDLAMGADVNTWSAIPGYVDYICPQLYYSFENPAMGYTEALQQWLALPRHQALELYIGLALYKAGSDADEGTWLSENNIIQRQIQQAREAGCKGVILYASDYLSKPETKEEVENAMAVLK